MNPQLRNRSFGGVRNPNVNVIDVSGRLQGMPDYASSGYAMASGTTQANLEQARAELKVLSDERVVLADAVVKAQQAINTNEASYQAGARGWNDCKNSDCKATHTAKRCGECRKPFNDMMIAAESKRPTLASAKNGAANNLAQKDAEITVVKNTIAGLLEAITAENASEQELATQGLTSESVAAQAQALAQAEVETARVQAETSASGKKTRNMVIALVVVAVVAVGVIFMIRKIRKNRK